MRLAPSEKVGGVTDAKVACHAPGGNPCCPLADVAASATHRIPEPAKAVERALTPASKVSCER